MPDCQHVIVTSCYGSRFWRSARNWAEHLRAFDQAPIEIIALDKGRLDLPLQRVTTIAATVGSTPPRYGDGDRFRLERIIGYLREGRTCFQIDLDVRMKRPFKCLAQLPYDFIVSRAFNFPNFAAERFGFVACTGFYVAKPSALPFAEALLRDINANVYGSSYDQYVVNAILWGAADNGRHNRDSISLEGRSLDVDTFEAVGCRIGVLPRETILRSADFQQATFGNHDLSFVPGSASDRLDDVQRFIVRALRKIRR
jgi:hypothetical protein